MIQSLAFKEHLQSKLTGKRVPLMDQLPVKLEITDVFEPMGSTDATRYRTEMRLYFEQTFRDGPQAVPPLTVLEQRAVLAIQRMLFDDVARELRHIQMMLWEQQQPVDKGINERIENLFNVLTR